MENSEKRVLKFHTGRGGMFNNQGHVTFEGFDELKEGDSNFDAYFFYEGETPEWREENGEELDYTCNNDGTGYINIDGDYDTTTWVIENELNVKQITAIVREIDGMFSEELREIVNNYYAEYLD